MSNLKKRGVYEASSGYVIALLNGDTYWVDRPSSYGDWFVYRNENGYMAGCCPDGKPFNTADAAVGWVLAKEAW